MFDLLWYEGAPLRLCFRQPPAVSDEGGLPVTPHQTLATSGLEAVTSAVDPDVSWTIDTFVEIQLLHPENITRLIQIAKTK